MLVVRRIVEQRRIVPGVPGPPSSTDGLGDRPSYHAFAFDGAWRHLGEIVAEDDSIGRSLARTWRWGTGLLLAPTNDGRHAALCDGTRWRTVALSPPLADVTWLDVIDADGGTALLTASTREAPASECPPSGPIHPAPEITLRVQRVVTRGESVDPDGADASVVINPPADARCWSVQSIRSAREGTHMLVSWAWCRGQWAGDTAYAGPCRVGSARFDGEHWEPLAPLGSESVEHASDAMPALNVNAPVIAMATGEGSRDATLWTWGTQWSRANTMPAGSVQWLGVPRGGDPLTSIALTARFRPDGFPDYAVRAYRLRDGSWGGEGAVLTIRSPSAVGRGGVLDDGTLIVTREDWRNARTEFFVEDGPRWRSLGVLDATASMRGP